jgi:hypothetical protein
MERQIANIEIAQQYIQQINDRFLVSDEPYDADTKTYNIGTFYIHRGMGQKGVEYTIREVTSETGGYKVHGKDGMLADQVCYYLEGFLQGHFGTCTLLGYELVNNEDGEAAEGTEEEASEEASDENIQFEADDEKAEG